MVVPKLKADVDVNDAGSLFPLTSIISESDIVYGLAEHSGIHINCNVCKHSRNFPVRMLQEMATFIEGFACYACWMTGGARQS